MPKNNIPSLSESDVNFVNKFNAMVLSQNPTTDDVARAAEMMRQPASTTNRSDWVKQALAETKPVWDKMAKELADDLLAEGRREGYFAHEPEDNSNPSQSKED